MAESPLDTRAFDKDDGRSAGVLLVLNGVLVGSRPPVPAVRAAPEAARKA